MIVSQMKGRGMTEIRTARLLLRRACWADLDDMHAVLAEEAGSTYWSSPPHRALDETREWLRAMIEADPGKSDDFVVVLDGRVIGKVGAFELPEFGFRLRADCCRQGYASEALPAFLDHVFQREDVPALIADVDPRNLPSLRLLARFGFVETHRAEGTWDTHIGLCDSVYLRLTREDWLNGAARQPGA